MKQAISLDTHIINPNKTPTGSVIWMHGLGANNHDFDSLVPDLSRELSLRFIFPNAPVRPVCINHQMPMRAWYDVYSLTDLNREDKTGIAASQSLIAQLIQDEIDHGMPAKKIVLAGFSQGGAMALYTGLRQQQTLGGILGLSCYLPLLHEHADSLHPSNLHTPILITHGSYDTTLPCFAGKMGYDMIQKTHSQAQWKEYPMAHEITPQETHDIREFFMRVF